MKARTRLVKYGPGGGRHVVSARSFGQTVGTYFGVSYGLSNVEVLGDKPGMNLKKHKGDINFTIVKDGKIVAVIKGVSEAGGLDLAGVAIGGLQVTAGVVVLVATEGWFIPTVTIAKGLHTMYNSVDTRQRGRAEVVFTAVYREDPREEGDQFLDLIEPKHWDSNGQRVETVRLGLGLTPAKVGYDWIVLLSVNASSCKRSPFFWDEILAQIALERNMAANDAMIVSSAADME